MANTSTLNDDFAGALDTAVRWPNSYGGPDTTGGQGRIPCAHTGGTPDYAGINSAATYSLDTVFAKLTAAAVNGGTGLAYTSLAILAATPEGTSLACAVNTAAGTIRFESNVDYFDEAATELTYDATAHAWLRIQRTGGNIVWSTSPDGTTWTTRRTLAQPAWTGGTDLAVLIESYRDSGTNNFAFVDNVNTAPGGGGPSAAVRAAFLAFF